MAFLAPVGPQSLFSLFFFIFLVFGLKFLVGWLRVRRRLPSSVGGTTGLWARAWSIGVRGSSDGPLSIVRLVISRGWVIVCAMALAAYSLAFARAHSVGVRLVELISEPHLPRRQFWLVGGCSG